MVLFCCFVAFSHVFFFSFFFLSFFFSSFLLLSDLHLVYHEGHTVLAAAWCIRLHHGAKEEEKENDERNVGSCPAALNANDTVNKGGEGGHPSAVERCTFCAILSLQEHNRHRLLLTQQQQQQQQRHDSCHSHP